MLTRVLAKTQVLCFYEARGECEGFLSGRGPRSQTTSPTELVLVTKKAVVRSQSRKNDDFQVPVLTRVLAKSQVLCFYEAHGECEGFLSGRGPRSQTTTSIEHVLVTKKAVLRSQSRKNDDFQVPVLTRVLFYENTGTLFPTWRNNTGTCSQRGDICSFMLT